MKMILLACAVLIAPILLRAQEKKETPKTRPPVIIKSKEDDTEKVFTKIEIESGTNQKQWQQYLAKAVVLTESDLRQIPPGTYKVDVQFIIDKHGYIGQAQAKNDPGHGFARRAVNIIRDYPGSWTPATQCGRSVNSYKTQSITFVVE